VHPPALEINPSSQFK